MKSTVVWLALTLISTACAQQAPNPTPAAKFMGEMSDLDKEEERLKTAAQNVGAGTAGTPSGEGRPVPGEMGRDRNTAFQGIELLGVRMTGYPVGTVLPDAHPLKNQMNSLNEKLAGPQREKADAERKASDLGSKVRDLTSETTNLEGKVKSLEKRIADLGKSAEQEARPKEKAEILQEWQEAQRQAAEERSKLDKAAGELAKVESQKAGEETRVKGAEAQLAPLRGQMQAVGSQIASEEAKRIDAWLKTPPINPGGVQ